MILDCFRWFQVVLGWKKSVMSAFSRSDTACTVFQTSIMIISVGTTPSGRRIQFERPVMRFGLDLFFPFFSGVFLFFLCFSLLSYPVDFLFFLIRSRFSLLSYPVPFFLLSYPVDFLFFLIRSCYVLGMCPGFSWILWMQQKWSESTLNRWKKFIECSNLIQTQSSARKSGGPKSGIFWL